MSNRKKRNRKRRGKQTSKVAKQALKSPKDIIDCILNKKSLLINTNDIYIGIKMSNDDSNNNDEDGIKTKEIRFKEIANCKYDDIIYLIMNVETIRDKQEENVILYDRRSGIDRIYGSGNTKQQQIWNEIRRKYIDKDIIKESISKQIKPSPKKQNIINRMNDKNEEQEEEKKMDQVNNNNIDYTINSSSNKINICIESKLKMNLIKLSRDDRSKISSETVNITKKGYYRIYKQHNECNSNQINYSQINIGSIQYNAEQNTILYHHNDNYKFCNFTDKKIKYNIFKNMQIEIINETTLNGCYVLSMDPFISNPVALNFASAKNPGGGFLNGSNAQEESIARNSGLYETLIKYEEEFYKYHKLHCKSMLYSHSMIYSQNIPIFRDENGNLLDGFYTMSFISSPAVNCKQFMKKRSGKKNKYLDDGEEIIMNTMKYRIDKILDIAIKHNHDSLILGAFGCGVFGNDPNVISDIFGSLLSNKYKFRFKRIRFSILKRNDNDIIFDKFVKGIKRHFGNQ